MVKMFSEDARRGGGAPAGVDCRRTNVHSPPVLEAQSEPDRPTGLTATTGDQSVTLTWTNPNDSTITRYEYQVNHNDTSTGKLTGWSFWADLHGSDTGSGTPAFTITGLTNGSEYRYKIRAVRAGQDGQPDVPSKPAPGTSPWYVSAIAKEAEPLPVSHLWVERFCDYPLKVRWKRVSEATGYDLNLSVTDRTNWQRVMTNKNYNAWQFSQWSKDKTYWFAIRAVNAHGVSAWTNVRSIAMPCLVEGLRASYAANGDISVKWNPATRANSYHVNFSPDGGASWQRLVSDTTATSYSFNKNPQTLPYNSGFLVAVQSRKDGLISGWRNAPVVQIHTVSNLAVAGSGPKTVGATHWAADFTTGPHEAGYTLQSVTTRIKWAGGFDALTWAIHTATKHNGKEVPSSTVQATLTGSTPIGTNYVDFTRTCDGDGCTLSPNTTYSWWRAPPAVPCIPGNTRLP